MSESLLAPRYLFRLSAPLYYQSPIWADTGVKLSDSHKLLSWAELDGERTFADVRAAWSEEGLTFTAEVKGKKQALWCRESRLEDSDGLQVWIDTRDTHNVHRASRFCHRFAFMPAGVGRNHMQPMADQLIINRARENAPAVRPQHLRIWSKIDDGGYQLAAHLPKMALAGFDPTEHPRLGFTYALFDRELGLQTFSAGLQYPFQEDPSVWATLEMVK